ncbi:GNAT family N-acetyltransferase [Lacisediminimonas sp.]|uniref:GNAT family N-acetyltransferase n=1 Tax=Lacisediminimonas sp. TaxID=3060582 RepID=UPI00271F13C9|nr:GNAT family N-acetyltransferase [Lacisediminimonas sp.]MDO8299964.1 GNAT family N-acetyltransferase [Lacisediminimonas sp.]
MSAASPVSIVVGDWAGQGAAAAPLRHAVFVVEQGVPLALELDEMDPLAEHAVAWIGEQAVGTARLLPDGHIGRMAVVAAQRGCGIGAALLHVLIERARLRGDPAVRLHAQVQASGFYRRFGFVEEGDVFDDAGIPHVAMRLPLRSGISH